MTERINKATGPESTFVESWTEWEGDGLDWMFFYGIVLHPAILADCVDKGFSPDSDFGLELCMNAMTASIVVYPKEGGEEITVQEYKIRVSIMEKL